MNDAGVRQELQVMAKPPIARFEPGIGVQRLRGSENCGETCGGWPRVSRR